LAIPFFIIIAHVQRTNSYYSFHINGWMQKLLQVHSPRVQREEAGAAAVKGRGRGGDHI